LNKIYELKYLLKTIACFFWTITIIFPCEVFANPIVIDYSLGIKGMRTNGEIAIYIILAVIVTVFLEFIVARFTFKSNGIFSTVFIANIISVPLTQLAAYYFLTRFPEGQIYLLAEIVPLIIEFPIYNSKRKILAGLGIAEELLSNQNMLATIILANIISFIFAGEVVLQIYAFFRLMTV